MSVATPACWGLYLVMLSFMKVKMYSLLGDWQVTKITLTDTGANYTATPTVILTGGKNDGSTPTDTAKAYANLNNDLARDFDMTIRFDRIS